MTNAGKTNALHDQEPFKYLTFDARRATFKSWIFKAGTTCNADNLAKAGFIKTDKIATMCVFCEKELEWEDPTEDPLKEHEDHSPECPFLPFMGVPETEWKAADERVAKMLAALAALAHMKPLRVYTEECDIAYKKAIGKLTPYIPKEDKEN